MFIKPIKPPLSIQVLEALVRRLPPKHTRIEEIKEELRITKAGYRGEQSLDYFLGALSSKKYSIFHDLRLPYTPNAEPYYFQIDVLLGCSTYLLILEVKNYAGTLFFDREFSQLIQTKDNLEKSFTDPISQAKRQQSLLMAWLKDHNFPQIPVECLVVICGTNTIIKSSPGYSDTKQIVLHKENLFSKIQALETKYKAEHLLPKDIRKLSKVLLAQHTPSYPNLREKYSITKLDFLKGVTCPACFALPMLRKRSHWTCPQCNHFSTDAYHFSLQDFAILIKYNPTLSEIQDFLQLPSRHITYRLIAKSPYPRIDSKRYQIVSQEKLY